MRCVLEDNKKRIGANELYALLRNAIAECDLPIVTELLLHGARFPDDQSAAELMFKFMRRTELEKPAIKTRLGIVSALLAFEGTRDVTMDSGRHADATDIRLVMLLIEHGVDIYARKGQYTEYGRNTRARMCLYSIARHRMGGKYADRLKVAQMARSTLFSTMYRRVDLYPSKVEGAYVLLF